MNKISPKNSPVIQGERYSKYFIFYLWSLKRIGRGKSCCAYKRSKNLKKTSLWSIFLRFFFEFPPPHTNPLLTHVFYAESERKIKSFQKIKKYYFRNIKKIETIINEIICITNSKKLSTTTNENHKKHKKE